MRHVAVALLVVSFAGTTTATSRVHGQDAARPVAPVRPRRVGAPAAPAPGTPGLSAGSPGVSRRTAAAALVFDSVTVVDVEQGRLVPNQRVVIAGNRIRAVGAVRAIPLPRGARVIPATGKYLIPGLWDLHVHTGEYTDVFYPLLLANGVTGIRDASSNVPLALQRQWRSEILAGRRVGPPRQILSGPAIDDLGNCKRDIGRALANKTKYGWAQGYVPPLGDTAKRREWLFATIYSKTPGVFHRCITSTPASARHMVDSLKAAGVDMIKTYFLTQEDYFLVAAAARRAGLPFGGHYGAVSAAEASDSGARILDHEPPSACWPSDSGASLAACRALAEHLRRNGTWVVPTMVNKWVNASFGDIMNDRMRTIKTRRPELYARYRAKVGPRIQGFWPGIKGDASRFLPHASSDSVDEAQTTPLRLAQDAGLPIAAGTDDLSLIFPALAPGFSLQLELTMNVAEGLTPLNALQSATLNPAKLLHATDSLGTVARGKLADLVLLDGDPLADITNTAAIRGVVANGRYFDRAALDWVLADTRAAGARLYPFWMPRP